MSFENRFTLKHAKVDFGTVAHFAHRAGKLLVACDPENLTREFHKVDRRGRILVDTGRNDYSTTFGAATLFVQDQAHLFRRHAPGRK